MSALRFFRNLLGALFGIAVITLMIVWYQYYQMNSYNEQIEKLVVLNKEKDSAESEMIDGEGIENLLTDSGLYLPQIDFEALKEINENTVGWIYACDGKISYPIVASPDEFYLEHAIDGTSSKAGTIFVNSNPEEAFPGNRSIIYGHNMRDGSMFHSLLQYWRDSSYLEKFPYIYVITENTTYTYEITSVYVAEYKDIIFTTNTDQNEDKIIDLITCEYSGKDTRLVVEAVESKN